MFTTAQELVIFLVIGIAIAAGLCSRAEAQEYRLLSADRLAVEYRQHVNYRDPYFPEYETIGGNCSGFREDGTQSRECMAYGANVIFDLTIVQLPSLTRIFWRNDAHMDATNRQVRHAAWKWEAGLTLIPKVELFHRHESRHIMEKDTPTGIERFPLRDEYVLSIDFYRRGR